MKIYHNGNQIFYAVYDKDLFNFSHTTNVPLSILTIDEVAANQNICLDIAHSLGKVNAEGNAKYYIQDGELYMTDDWEAYHEDNA